MNPSAYPDKLDIPDLPDEEPAVPPSEPRRTEGVRAERARTERPAGSGTGKKPASGPAAAERGPGGPLAAGFDPSSMFSALDADGDGVLSAKELQSIPADRRADVTAADSDGDGQVSRAGFTAAVARFGAAAKTRRKPEGGGP